MLGVARENHGVMWEDFTPDEAFLLRTRELELGTYSKPEYNRKK